MHRIWGVAASYLGMSQSSGAVFRDVPETNDSFRVKYAEECRLCGIIESEQSTAEEKYRALIQLAYLSGALAANGLADAA